MKKFSSKNSTLIQTMSPERELGLLRALKTAQETANGHLVGGVMLGGKGDITHVIARRGADVAGVGVDHDAIIAEALRIRANFFIKQ